MKYWNGAGSPYSSPMNSNGTNGDKQSHAGSDFQRFETYKAGEAVASGTITHLIVVLAADYEF